MDTYRETVLPTTCGPPEKRLENMVDLLNSFYRDKAVFVTRPVLQGRLAEPMVEAARRPVHGYSCRRPTDPSLHEVVSQHALAGETIEDIRMSRADRSRQVARPASFPSGRAAAGTRSYREPAATFEVNGLGT